MALNVTNLSAAQLINRAESVTCTGCHRSSQGDSLGFGTTVFPAALPFRQVGDSAGTTANFSLSAAVQSFLVFRKAKR